VKIKGTCKRCGREFLLGQVVGSGGACPWDGQAFQADYAVVLVEALQTAAAAGAEFERALESIADLQPEFTLDVDTVVADVKAQLARLERNLIRQG
jgi:hypothetical protein